MKYLNVKWFLVILWGAGSFFTCEAAEQVRLNDIQYIGTHNSYHIEPDQAVFDKMLESSYAENNIWTAEKLAKALAFTHPSIENQLTMGMRLFEFDLHDDPEGGRFATPGFLSALDPQITASLDPVDAEGALLQPGMKVFHTVDTDVRSHCLRLARCLEIIRDWSLANPQHAPIFIQIETKEGRKPILAGAYPQGEAAPFNDAAWKRLHREILSVFKAKHILLPKEVRGRFSSLNEAVRKVGWPQFEDTRGRVVFLLLDDPLKQDQYAALTGKRGEEAILFVSRHKNDPDTGWLIEPKPQADRIKPLVQAGFIVYTRADKHTKQARRNDRTQATNALASGAQLISTDFPRPDQRYGPYHVSFGQKYIRCNPVRRPQGCVRDQEATK